MLFFSVSRSKLPGYVLPALAPLSLLIVRFIATAIVDPKRARWLLSLSGVLLVVGGYLAGAFADSAPYVTDLRPPDGPGQFGMIAILGGIAAAALALFRWPRASVSAATLTVLALLTLPTEDLWQLDEGISARPAVQKALERMTPEQVTTATVFKLRRAYKFQVDFYLGRETNEWSPQTDRRSIVFTDYQHSEELAQLGGWCAGYSAFPAVWVCEGSKDDQNLSASPRR
jgi:4-amino-4-deoxy-L-arabinose transferase-like glycosyltransferase